MKNVLWMLCLIPLTGCLHSPVKESSEITLVDAMRQVGYGLSEMRIAQGDIKTGLIAESAEVTFNISTNSKNGGSLAVDLSAPAIMTGAGISGNLSGERNSARANTVTVKFKNILMVPKDTVGYIAADAQVKSSADTKPVIVIPEGLPTWIQKHQRQMD